jgi:hypothetical protein
MNIIEMQKQLNKDAQKLRNTWDNQSEYMFCHHTHYPELTFSVYTDDSDGEYEIDRNGFKVFFDGSIPKEEAELIYEKMLKDIKELT